MKEQLTLGESANNFSLPFGKSRMSRILMVGVLTFPCIILILICPTMSCLDQYWPTALCLVVSSLTTWLFQLLHIPFWAVMLSFQMRSSLIHSLTLSAHMIMLFFMKLCWFQIVVKVPLHQSWDSLLNNLSTMGCHELPTVGNIQHVMSSQVNL